MSSQLISRSADLQRLRDEGYDLEIRAGYLVVRRVPYVDSSRQVRYGELVSDLELAGDTTTRPTNHVTMFAGAAPCDQHGVVLSKIVNSTQHQELGDGLAIDHTFSSKPPGGYTDYYDKMIAYIRIVAAPALTIDDSVTATPFPVVLDDECSTVFNYIDTASSRAGINVISNKLALAQVAIVGVGGTGSYVLDLVAKTLVHEIHLFDGDRFLQHNSFRSPGAASIEDLDGGPSKVSYFAQRYSKMHRNILVHPYCLEATNTNELSTMDFVFLCIDKGGAKKAIVDVLEEAGIRFVDVGMGVQEVDGALGGVVRVTTSTSEMREHVHSEGGIPFGDAEADDYGQNIQIADLNALNAALAVIRWKKLCGFYRDLENEHFDAYTIDGNHMTNEDQR